MPAHLVAAKATTFPAVLAGLALAALASALPASTPQPIPMPPGRAAAYRELGIEPSELLRSSISAPSTTEALQLEARRHYFMATYLGQTGRIKDALGHLLKADQKLPGNFSIRLLLAEYKLESGAPAEALEIVNGLLKTQPESVQALLLKAQVMLLQAESASGARRAELNRGAMAVLVAARKTQPLNESVLRNLARLYARANDLKGLESVYRDLVTGVPRDPGNKLFLARLLSETNRPEEGLEFYDKVINQRRGYVPARMEKARVQEMLGRLADAAATYRDAILVEPRNRQVREAFDRVLRLLHQGDDATSKVLQAYSEFSAQYPYSSEIRRIYAEQLLSAGDKAGAIREFRRIVEADDDNPDAHLNLGKLLLTLGRTEEALGEFQKAHDLRPDSAEALNLFGSSLLTLGRANEAGELFRKALRDMPDNPDLQLGLAAVMIEARSTTEAAALVASVVPNIQRDAQRLARAGQLLLRLRDYPAAAQALNRATTLAPNDLPALSLAVRALVRANDTQAAISLLQRARARSNAIPPDELHLLLAEELQAAGKIDEAAKWYLEANQAAPERIGVLARITTYFSIHKQHDRALEIIAATRALTGESDELLRLEAAVHLDSKEYDRALEAYRKLAELRPGSIEPVLLTAEALAVAKRLQAALAELTAAEKKFGANEDIEFTRGVVFLRLKRYDQAARAFRKIAESNGRRSVDALYFLGTTLAETRKFDDAEKAYRLGLKKSPDDPRILNGLGYLLADQNRELGEARSLIERALEFQPRAGHIIDSMAWLLYRENRFEEAYEWITEALAFSGPEPEIIEHKGMILEALGRPDEAAEAYRKAVALEPERTASKARLRALDPQPESARPGRRSAP